MDLVTIAYASSVRESTLRDIDKKIKSIEDIVSSLMTKLDIDHTYVRTSIMDVNTMGNAYIDGHS